MAFARARSVVRLTTAEALATGSHQPVRRNRPHVATVKPITVTVDSEATPMAGISVGTGACSRAAAVVVEWRSGRPLGAAGHPV